MRLRRSALSFLLLTGLSLGALSPARAADDPTPGPADAGQQLVDGVAGATDAKPDPSPTTEPLSEPSTHEEAVDDLDAVKGLFVPHVSAAPASDGGDATMALRDLTLHMAALTPAQRLTLSTRAYDRPWSEDFPHSPAKCDDVAKVCVHWISQTDANTYWPQVYAATDGAIDLRTWVSTDAWAATALKRVAEVSTTYTRAGYRHPRADGSLGGSSATDIYLTDPGSEGLYGYCTVDGTVGANGAFHPHFSPSNSRASDLPAFCVLDNDYANRDSSGRPLFGNHTPEENLEVTAAHEYFHAVQFAYDYLEDRWFMEATATWAEDEVYTDINDNVQYLRFSQLRFPRKSLDDNQALNGFLHYGDWIFFRYLTERMPAKTGKLPNLMLQIWNRADSVKGPDQYSIQAVARTLGAHGLAFPRLFAQYAAANRHPATAYTEGRANHYPVGRPARTVTLKPSRRSTSGTPSVDHLASATIRLVPARLSASKRLRLSVDMADRSAGSSVVAIVYYKDGRISSRPIQLTRSGSGHLRVPFGSRSIRAVELTLANGNIRYRHCSTDVDGFSCGGVPAKDNVVEKYAARVL
ncbi:hypothetical protein JCM18899A_37420 [Nocardioides sp. AN3]